MTKIPQSFSARVDKDEHAFLLTYMPQYELHQVKKNYREFWPPVLSAYNTKFSLLEKLWPNEGKTLKDLNHDETEIYAAALAAKQNSIREWFRWRGNPRSRNTSNVVKAKDLKRIYQPERRRGHKPYEMFVKLNRDTFNAVWDETCRIQGVKGSGRLAIYHKVGGRLWHEATDDVKQAVYQKIDEEAKERGEELERIENGEDTPESYQYFQNALPAILTAAIDPAVRRAGMIAVCTMIGPVPEAGGQIVATTLQFGDSADTPLFSQAWLEHDKSYVEALAKFAVKHEFSEELCAKRALGGVAGGQTEDVASAGENSAEGPSQTSANSPTTTDKGKNPATCPVKGKQLAMVPAEKSQVNGSTSNGTSTPTTQQPDPKENSPAALSSSVSSNSNLVDPLPSPQPSAIPGVPSAPGAGFSNVVSGLLTAPGAPGENQWNFEKPVSSNPNQAPRELYHDSEIPPGGGIDFDLDADGEGDWDEDNWEALLQSVDNGPEGGMGSVPWANMDILNKMSSTDGDVNFTREQQSTHGFLNVSSTYSMPFSDPPPSSIPSSPSFQHSSASSTFSPTATTSRMPPVFHLQKSVTEAQQDVIAPCPPTSSVSSSTPGSLFGGGSSGTGGTLFGGLNGGGPLFGGRSLDGGGSLFGSSSSKTSGSLFGCGSGGGSLSSNVDSPYPPVPPGLPSSSTSASSGLGSFGRPPLTGLSNLGSRLGAHSSLFGTPSTSGPSPSLLGSIVPSPASSERMLPGAVVASAAPPVPTQGVTASQSAPIPTTSAVTPEDPTQSPATTSASVKSTRTSANVEPDGSASQPAPSTSSTIPASSKPPKPPITARSSLGIPALGAQRLSQDKAPATQPPRFAPTPGVTASSALGTTVSPSPIAPVGTKPATTPSPNDAIASAPGATSAPATSVTPDAGQQGKKKPVPQKRGPRAARGNKPSESSAPGTASPTPPTDLAPEPSPPSAPGVDPTAAAETPEVGNAVSRRSGRTVIKNTWLERQNLIGSNAISHSASSETTTDNANNGELPAWFLAVVEYLRDSGLGDEWTEVLEKWASLERSLGYGKVAKTPLPVMNRPEEWSKWTTKFKRAYNKIPTIEDPAEFGLALTKWWCALQPSFRLSDAGSLLPVYSDPSLVGDAWAQIRKSGPNGFVVVIMLLDWWGRSAHVATVFQEDSRGAWRDLVRDVSLCLDVMAEPKGASGAKRPLEEGSASGNKRQRSSGAE